ncbi:Hypothetical predicted protein [Paramuricea clavata]|uniref:Uncharacterized protein n=1 Tax=Paramuricea clavata TaxID=317549 RepID=A0A7D9HCH1_PARCT|nr:Hypothetical predicted protein [Paramuricea clavata]
MPTPSKFEAVVPLCGNGEDNENNSFETRDVFSKDILDDNAMALVLVERDKLQTKTKQPDEAQGRLSNLIKGWCRFSSTFYRRDSCQFTTCVSPCVRKATTHLQQLNDQLTRLSVVQEGTQPVDYMLAMCGEESPASVMPESQPILSRPVSYGDTSAASSIELSTVGFSPLFENTPCRHSSTSSSQNKTSSSLEKSNTSAEKQHSAHQHLGFDVVEEVVRLMARMEDDRLSTQQMLINERQRVNHLRSQIDQLAFKRLMDLPAAVQKEHESCATDINELKWHCGYQGRVETRLGRKVDQAELQHLKIIGELQSSKESCPLVREKLELEDIAMASIQLKQDETDEELRQTLKRLEATQQKTKEAKALAIQERTLIKKDVDIIRNLLNEVSDELAQLKMNYTSNVHTISDIKNTLKENAQQCVNLEKREEWVKNQEAAQHDKVGKLREKIVEQTSEHARLTEENEKLKKDNQIMEGDYQSSITKLKIEIKQYEIQVRELSRKNKALREDMDNIVKQTEKFKKQRTSEKKALIRAGQEAEKVKQHIEMMNEEVKKLKTLNHSLKLAKARAEEDYFTEEDSLRTAEQSLKNQLKEESHARTILQARIATDTSDLLRSRIDSKKKKEKMSQQALDADKVLNSIREQVERLETVHSEREQTIAQISEVLEKLNKQREEMESKYRARIVELRPKEEQNKHERLELQQKIDHIQWRSDMMSTKIKDMSSSTVMMTRVIDSTAEDIAKLEEDDKEVRVRLEASNDAEDSLKEVLQAAKDRLLCRKKEHILHVNNRKLALHQTSIALDEKLAENKALAERYQRLYSQHLQTKDLFFKKYENIVNEESHLKDHKELYTLQGRLRECLQHYYKLRGLQNKSQVAQFKVNSKHNNDKLFQLKQELSDVVIHINDFLKNISESHQTISLKDYKETSIVR